MGTNKSWIWATSQASENGVRTRLATTHPCNLHIQQSFRMHVAEEAWPSNTQPAMRVDAYFLPNLKHLLCLVSGMVVSGGWLPFVRESFSIAFMNLRKCLIYSGNVSKLQWPPPLTHNGSYFSFASSHRRFPWEKSTISSSVPCKTQAFKTYKISKCCGTSCVKMAAMTGLNTISKFCFWKFQTPLDKKFCQYRNFPFLFAWCEPPFVLYTNINKAKIGLPHIRQSGRSPMRIQGRSMTSSRICLFCTQCLADVVTHLGAARILYKWEPT